jgi:hypothetical protein
MFILRRAISGLWGGCACARVPAGPGSTMIVASFGQYLVVSGHDHGPPR